MNSDLQANLTLQPHVIKYCLLIQKIEKKKKMLGVKTTQSPFDLIYPLEGFPCSGIRSPFMQFNKIHPTP